MGKGNQFLQVNLQKFTWDSSVDTAMAQSTSYSLGTLPDNAVIIGGFVHVVTDMTDSDAGDNSTFSIGYTGATTAFLAATAVSSLETGTLVSLLPGNPALGADAAHDTAAEVAALVASSYILLSGNKELLLTTGANGASVTINGGKINIWVQYVVSE